MPLIDSLFPAPPEQGEPLITLSMTREVADRLVGALGYGAAVSESMAEANKAPETRAKITTHAETLRWAYSRLGALTGRFGPAAASDDHDERRNRLVAEWTDDGGVTVDFVDSAASDDHETPADGQEHAREGER